MSATMVETTGGDSALVAALLAERHNGTGWRARPAEPEPLPTTPRDLEARRRLLIEVPR